MNKKYFLNKFIFYLLIYFYLDELGRWVLFLWKIYNKIRIKKLLWYDFQWNLDFSHTNKLSNKILYITKYIQFLK